MYLYSLIIGIFAGTISTLFLAALDYATQMRQAHPLYLWLLPLSGLLTGLIYHFYGQEISAGTNLVIDEIHEHKKRIPFRMTPFVFFSTFLTQLSGGSAGREGAMIQMSASLADQLPRWFEISKEERRPLLIAGAGAGFASALGAPFAGIIFGMEFIHAGRLRIVAFIQCTIAAFTAQAISHLLHVHHSHYPHYEGPAWSFKSLVAALLASIFFAAASRAFMGCTHQIESFYKKFVKIPYFRPFIGGCILLLLFQLFTLDRYQGLGIDTIQNSLNQIQSWKDPILKLLLTALTIGSGFKGGEFTPLVFIGTTLGSSLSKFDPSLLPVMSRIGFAAIFSAAAKTPIACSIMAVELFGLSIAPYAFIACMISFLLSGKNGIYSSQRKVL